MQRCLLLDIINHIRVRRKKLLLPDCIVAGLDEALQ